MSRDLNNNWLNNRKCMTSYGRFSKFAMNGLISGKESKFAYKPLKEYKQQNSTVQKKTNIQIISKDHINSVEQSTGNDNHRCNMKKYLCYTTKQCQPVLTEYGLAFPRQANKTEVTVKSVERTASLSNNNQKRYSRYSVCDIDNVFFDCDTLKNSYLYGKHSAGEEEEFPLAFTMKIHKSENQAHRLLRYIYQKHNLYCIHVDKKSPPEIYFKFLEIGKCFDNIIVIKDRVNVVYSTIRQVDAELKCMKEMLKHNITWKYYINLTGEEFMLKTNLEIVNILKILNGTNDIESTFLPPKEYHKVNQKTVIMGNYPFVSNQKKAPFSQSIKIRKGSAYGMFSREFVKFVLTDLFVMKFVDWLKDAYAPEELIWATLNNLPSAPGGREKIISGESFFSRAVKWQMDDTLKCGGKYVRWVCVYGTMDLPWLLKHRNIVANKFYENYEPLTLDCVENSMYSRLIAAQTSETYKLDEYRQLLASYNYHI
ncbi:beta-1 [Mactra antiquata]